MSRILRAISTAVIGIGLVLLFLYLCLFENKGKELALIRPSYYVIRNYLYVFFAGAGCIAFSVISSFFSWSKALDKKEEILPNAISAEKGTVHSWLAGSSLDTEQSINYKKTAAGHGMRANKNETDPDTVIEPTGTDYNLRKAGDQNQNVQTSFNQENTILDNTEETVLEAYEDRTVLDDTKS